MRDGLVVTLRATENFRHVRAGLVSAEWPCAWRAGDGDASTPVRARRRPAIAIRSNHPCRGDRRHASGAPLFVVANYLCQRANSKVPPRYGSALVVCFPALLALLRPRRDVSIALVIIASGLAISVGGLLVGAVV